MTDYLSVEGLAKRFDGFDAVADVSLSLTQGEILALLGPSGSGKTTTLRLLAGFERPDAGRILVAGQDVTRLAPARRHFGMVFQHYALFPHLDVGRNVAFGLESQGIPPAEITARVATALGRVDLTGFERRSVAALSGGQQQRVALARALAPEPRVLLLDEPLSNLDPTLRERTRRELRELIHRIGITTVLVTHEQEEAFELGDRVALLRDGRLQQVGTPDVLYETPVNPFVAGFVGRSSRLSGRLEGGTPPRVFIEGVSWDVPRAPHAGGEVWVVVRPEGLTLTAPGPGVLTGTVRERRFLGAAALFRVVTEGGATIEVSATPRAAAPGDVVGLAPTGVGLHLFPADAP